MKGSPQNLPESGRESGRSPLDWPAAAGVGRELAREIRAEVRRRSRRRVAVAGAACLFLAVGAGWWSGTLVPPAAVPAVADAHVAAPERRALPDGSILELKPGAVVNVAYSPTERRVELARGEVHVSVAKNPARPFVVAVDGVEVRAVGTAFAVGRNIREVDVLVTEGRVALTRPTPVESGAARGALPVEASSAVVAPEPVFLGLGDRTTVSLAAQATPAPGIETTSPAEIARRLAWRIPRFEFAGASLARVVQMFNERGFARLEIEDRALDAVRISGVLRADNVEALLQLLASDHGIESELAAGTVRLRRAR